MGGPESRRLPVDDKGRDPLRPVPAGAGHDEEVVGLAAAGAELLAPRDGVAVLGLLGPGAQARGIRAGRRLGQGVGPEPLPRQHGREQLAPGLHTGKALHGVADEGMHADPHRKGDPGPRQALDEVEILPVGPPAAAVGGIEREPGEALRPQLPVDGKGVLPPFLVLRRQLGEV